MEALILNYINHDPVYIKHLLKLCFKNCDKTSGEVVFATLKQCLENGAKFERHMRSFSWPRG